MLTATQLPHASITRRLLQLDFSTLENSKSGFVPLPPIPQVGRNNMSAWMWLIILPVNATGGNSLTELNRISTSNVKEPARYWAHALVAWLFFGNTSFQSYPL